ncbi:Na(+)-translocating NADH-quinone reductase subunit C [Planctomycetes bacterium Pan216]|uniref:Na(+)-translocating NADH-quinone reductase subunit C n=1 Tax=Kolteria novifilia TaxID=2527975 RepID=A0A518AYB0_9BACT|nr:Na(+)-translocating NADH-quinone reductase subunit C [Planctomycetes bacterium Pan216]
MQDNNLYTIKFMLIICVACAVGVSVVAMGLKPLQMYNAEIDNQKNVLSVVGLLEEGKSYGSSQISSMYKERIKSIVVNGKGEVVEDGNADELDLLTLDETNKGKPEEEQRWPIFEVEEGGKVVTFAIPISGRGLWSALYGYLALDANADTVAGITFYKEGETAGLGAEIRQPWFQEQFKGKEILEGDKLVSIKIFKPGVPIPADMEEHSVHGISGATITSTGVQDLLVKDLNRYKPFFASIWQSEGK